MLWFTFSLRGKKRRFWVQFSALHPSLPCCTNLHHSGVFNRIFMQTQIILCHMGMVTLLLTNPHIFWRFILRLKCYDFGSNSNKRRKANKKKKTSTCVYGIARAEWCILLFNGNLQLRVFKTSCNFFTVKLFWGLVLKFAIIIIHMHKTFLLFR